MNKNHRLPQELSEYQNNVIYEEYANDTAVAIGRVSLEIKKRCENDNVIILALPADHYIYNVDSFIEDIVEGIRKVNSDNIVLYGIDPHSPETKYGYIIPGDKITFREKPTLKIALELINQNALWNSGIFAADNNLILKCIADSSHNIMDWIENPRDGKAPSFDIVVLQEYSNIHAHHCHGWRWSDIGTWDAFLDVPEIQDEIQESTNVKIAECTNTTVLKRPKDSPGNIVVIGCNDLFIASNGPDILIMPKKSSIPDDLSTTDYNSILKLIASDIMQ
jgi:mannose-1-phosphate guanylyltransferase